MKGGHIGYLLYRESFFQHSPISTKQTRKGIYWLYIEHIRAALIDFLLLLKDTKTDNVKNEAHYMIQKLVEQPSAALSRSYHFL